MNREDLRKVEFTVKEKAKSKKGKKSQKKQVKKVGLFHIWNPDGKNKKKFYGLIEDVETGLLREVSYKDIRFLSDNESQPQQEETAMPQTAETDVMPAAQTEVSAEEPKKETPAPTSRRKAGAE